MPGTSDRIEVSNGSIEKLEILIWRRLYGTKIYDNGAWHQCHCLKPGMKPEATFKTTEKVVATFEYCNLHGLWKADA